MSATQQEIDAIRKEYELKSDREVKRIQADLQHDFRKESARSFGQALGYATAGIILLLTLIGGGLVGCPYYNVWTREMKGKASLMQATQDSQIKTLQAKAAKNSAVELAQAEVIRARGANEANKAMINSLGTPENYLRWSYIDMLRDTAGKGDRTVLYVPTESAMPIMEAGRAVKTPE